MKKILFVLSLAFFVCALCIVASAAQITSGQDFKAALTSGADGEYTVSGDLSDTSEAITVENAVNIVFNLTGDTVIDDNITVLADANIKFNLNGYNLVCTRMGSDYSQGFLRLKSQNCCVTLNGQREENGAIVNSIQTSDLLVYCHGGKIVCNNVNITSAEAMFYSRDVSLPTTIQVDGGNYRVTGADPFISSPNMCNNSYFKNCTLSTERNKKITLDDNCSNAFRDTVYGGKGYDFVFENVLMDNFSFTSKTSLINFVFIDLVNNLDDNPDNDITLSNITLGSDRHKTVTTSEATIIISSTCTRHGTSQHKTYTETTVITTELPLADHAKSNVIAGIEYESYLEKGKLIYECANDGCNVKIDGESAPALFVCLGYSAPENGDGGISIRYTVNSDAIAKYKEVTGKELSYGLFATTKQAAGNEDIFDSKGEAINGAIALDVTESDFAFISLKMVGFDTEDSKKIDFAIGAYVVTTLDGNKSYSYLQDGTPVNGEKYAFIKYNDFVK
jgi:hypothetical protein